MKTLIRFLLGLNGASIVRGLRLGPAEFVSGCFDSLNAAHPLENRRSLDQKKIRAELNLIPRVELGHVLADLLGVEKYHLQLDLRQHENGQLPLHEALALLAILVAEHPAEVLEIGTFMGHTTKAMAENLPSAFIHTVDLPQDYSEPENTGETPPKDDFHLIQRRVVGREFKDQALAARIRQHFGDTARIDFKEFGRPSFFFIDGSHTYEYCKQDSDKCFALCNGQGTFLWHDCDENHPGVVKLISEWRAAQRNISRIAGTSIAYWKSQ